MFQRLEFVDQDGECFALAVEFLLQNLNLRGQRDACLSIALAVKTHFTR